MANIVFLILSPNMWDGFQTLWEDLSANSENNISVIQLSLFEKKDDEAPKELPSPTGNLPKEITLLPCKEYDWEGNHTDVIYTQYAQDGSNLGFSVDPFFYVSNLRKYADSIVYIPYPVMTEPSIKNDLIMRDLRPLLVYNSLSFVDKIIVQSENMKNVYIELLAGKNEVQRNFWEKKISWEDYPRRAVLERYMKATPKMPELWKNSLLKADGSQKKTLFLSTSVNGILTQNHSLIRSTRAFFESSLADIDNTAIIWRPYPLIPDVLRKMRPQLIEDYNKLVDFFSNSGLGVFDDSSSPSMAITFSDEYVGDPCGIMELFKITGKPVKQLFTVL